MERDDIARLVESINETIWEKHEIEKLKDFYHLELEAYYNDDKLDFQGLEKKLQIYKEHMSNLKVEVLDLVVEGDSFALRANHLIKRDNKDLKIFVILIAYLKDNKINKYFIKTEMPLEFNV